MLQMGRWIWEGLKIVGREIPGVEHTWHRLQRRWLTERPPNYIPVSMNREKWNESYAQKKWTTWGSFRSCCAIAPLLA